MTSTPFTPYWKAVGPPADPYSWVFFVVAQIAGHHRPVAVVSSLGDNIQDETLQGYPLTAACQRIVTIFADLANHPAIRAELALAAGYYMRHSDRDRQQPVELPELNRVQARRPMQRWYRGMQEFPFIAACLLQGVGFDAQKGVTRAAQPEPLGTVYRDTSIEWGMVVVDITKLDAVSYGIVGFSVGPMKFVTSHLNEGYTMGARGPGAFERGELRLMDKVRARSAMSAAEYLAKFKHHHETLPTYDKNNSKQQLLLANISLIDAAAMDLVWPQKNDVIPSLANLSVGTDSTTKRSLPDQAITSLIQSTFDIDDFDMSIFDEVRAIPNFQDLLWRNLMQHSARLGSTRSAGQLIRLAFVDQEHLGLEQLENLSAEAILAALGVPEMSSVNSISLCIDSIRSTPAQLIHVLSRADTLREIYFIQSPTRESDSLSLQLFEELATRPQMLLRAKIMLAGAYSAALRKRFWLPTIPKIMSNNIPNAVQVAPLDVFPVQQMFVRHQITPYGNIKFEHKYVYLGDGLLKPERFAAGFLLYLHSLVPSMDATINPEAQVFSFSSAPASLAVDTLTSAEISPILAENLATAAECWPRVRDLVPSGWTVIVSLERYWNQEVARATRFSNTNRASYSAYFIRYAFVRAWQQRIVVDHPPLTPPGPEELKVVGLKEFLNATAPDVDSAVVDRRLHDVVEALNGLWYQGTLPPGIEPVSVLSQTEAAEMLLDFLENARK